MNTITRYQEWFNRNSAKIAAASVITTIGVLVYVQNKYVGKDLLEVTPTMLKMLEAKGGAFVYPVYGRDIMIQLIPTPN